MNIYLYGPDTFRSRGQLNKMVTKFKADRDPQGLNVVRLKVGDIADGLIIQEILAVPFLAERRMIVVENLLTTTGKQDIQTAILEKIESNAIPDSNVVIFVEGSDKPKTKSAKALHAFLAKEKFAQEFKELQGCELEQWIVSEIHECGGTIAPQACRYLANHLATDMWQLHGLIDQLTTYTSQEIELKDIQLFVDEKDDDNIFNLVDAIVAGQHKRAYAMMRRQYDMGKDAHYVFAMVLRQMRILLQMRDLYERDDSMHSADMAKKLKLHPFVVKKSLPFIKRHTIKDLSTRYEELLAIDIKTKTGQGDQSVLLDVFVGRV